MAADIHPVPALVAASRWLESSSVAPVRLGALRLRDAILQAIRTENPMAALVSSSRILWGPGAMDYNAREKSLPREIIDESHKVPKIMAGRPSPLSYAGAGDVIMRTFELLTAESRSREHYEMELDRWRSYAETLCSTGTGAATVSQADVAMAGMSVCEFQNATGRTYEDMIRMQAAVNSVEQFFASLPKIDKPPFGSAKP